MCTQSAIKLTRLDQLRPQPPDQHGVEFGVLLMVVPAALDHIRILRFRYSQIVAFCCYFNINVHAQKIWKLNFEMCLSTKKRAHAQTHTQFGCWCCCFPFCSFRSIDHWLIRPNNCIVSDLIRCSHQTVFKQKNTAAPATNRKLNETKWFGIGFGLMHGNYSSRFYWFHDCFALADFFSAIPFRWSYANELALLVIIIAAGVHVCTLVYVNTWIDRGGESVAATMALYIKYRKIKFKRPYWINPLYENGCFVLCLSFTLERHFLIGQHKESLHRIKCPRKCECFHFTLIANLMLITNLMNQRHGFDGCS